MAVSENVVYRNISKLDNFAVSSSLGMILKAIGVIAAAIILSTEPATAASEKFRGPHFRAWNLKYGLIESEDDEWNERAIANGTLENRELSCKVVKQTSVALPSDSLSGISHTVRFGLTFEYETTRPNVPYSVALIFPPDPDENGGEEGSLPGEKTGKRGRFCYSEESFEASAQQQGIRCYQVTIEAVPLPRVCIDIKRR